MSPPKELRILFVFVAKANPYQRLLSRELKPLGAKVIPDRNCPILRNLAPILHNLLFHGRPDVLHLHWPEMYMNSKISAVALIKGVQLLGEVAVMRLLGVKIVWTIHNIQSHESRNPRIQNFFLTRLKSFTSACIVLSDYMMECAERDYHFAPSDLHVISIGHYRDVLTRRISRAEARDSLAIAEKNLVFLYVGAIREYKGVPQLIEAFASANLQDALLIVSGKPDSESMRKSIMDQAAASPGGNIRLNLKFTSDEEMESLLAAADVYVVPHRHITTSATLILGMSAGKAVIAPGIGSVGEYLDDEGGFIYDPGDPKGLQRAIQTAQENKAGLEAMGRHNAEMSKQWTWEEIAQKTIAVYREVLDY